MTNRVKSAVAAAVVLVCAATAWFLVKKSSAPSFQEDKTVRTQLEAVTTSFRKIIVLMDGAQDLNEALLSRCRTTGRRIFYAKQEAVESLTERLQQSYPSNTPDPILQTIQYVASSNLRDADKLAFLDLFEDLQELAGPNPPRTPINDALRTTLDELHSIQLAYREEVTKIFSQFATRGGKADREKWDSYVRYLQGITTRDKVLAEYSDGISDEEPAEGGTRGAKSNEIFGSDFAPKTVALTFDDGPHPKYTEEVTALLRKYGIRACFFELGKNLGSVNSKKEVKLLRNADISKRLLDAGHVIANHTYSHRVLPKLSEADRTTEIESTSLLLEKVSGQKTILFRPPYGARNKQVLDRVTEEGLQSVMWTIDSEDWADPIPESIAMRVLHALNKSQKGIILFHDIHKQSVLALPAVLDELKRQEYTFLTFDNAGKFVKSTPPKGAERSLVPVETVSGARLNPYRESWAVIIGINDYQSWPKLRYSVNDANAIEDTLINNFGFKREKIRKLLNGDATRQRIMQVLGDELADSNKVSHDDRIFFFFAGHGATRTMPDGRQLGFIVPVDADQANYYSTAISMAALREACDLIPAKHMYFVMDSCYSGLALSRGAGGYTRDRSYLEEVTRRVARQILTAGGADQQVADDGPNGHSVFTWAFLQGLEGKADLDGNGVVTASELGAYVSPIVASFSKQTPAMGNMVGSEGGEFIFELKPQALTAMTPQLDSKERSLNDQLASLEHQVAAKQAELLKLQQSIQAESTRLVQLGHGEPAASPKPRQARAYDLDRMALQFYREKKYDEALKALQQAVELKPQDATIMNNLGFLYYKLGRFEEARSTLEKTLTLDPNRKEAHGNLADTYAKLGRNKDAKDQYQEYLVLYPASPRAEEIRRLMQTL